MLRSQRRSERTSFSSLSIAPIKTQVSAAVFYVGPQQFEII
jgi:hypothetical protein